MALQHILYSMVMNRCPRCNKGQVFKCDNPYNLKRMQEMHIHCASCDLKYEKEPGFFYGAMYVAYALTSGWFIMWFVLDLYLLHLDTEWFVLFMVLSFLLLAPLTFRWSRLLYISFFAKYDPNHPTKK